jgi:hypothetical protein
MNFSKSLPLACDFLPAMMRLSDFKLPPAIGPE